MRHLDACAVRTLHIRIPRPTTAFRHHPIDILRGVFDVAGFAVYAVLGVDLETRAGGFLDDFVLRDEYLDEHNGHSDAVRGYHYQVTLSEDDDGNFSPAFPYTVGPTFYGKLPTKAMTSCAAD
jgi:hypothetical protein